jgi:hypothetical protein
LYFFSLAWQALSPDVQMAGPFTSSRYQVMYQSAPWMGITVPDLTTNLKEPDYILFSSVSQFHSFF